MWALSVAVFGGFKWATLAQTLGGGVRPAAPWRVPAYLMLWPGMDARGFLTGATAGGRARAWAWAALKTGFGAAMLWWVVRRTGGGLLAGWVGMVGLIFLLHFGSFDLLALFWRRLGADATPLMRAPVLSASLGEFWGRRWNSGFRDLVFGLWFARLKARHGARAATLLLFLFSGLVHDLVISLPARGGYGLPTAYFLLQGAGTAGRARARLAAGALAGSVARSRVDVAHRGGPGLLVVPSAVRAAGDAAVFPCDPRALIFTRSPC